MARALATGAVLVAAARDERGFDVLWKWTCEHLQRDHGLLPWRCADGAGRPTASGPPTRTWTRARALVLAGHRAALFAAVTSAFAR